MGYHGIFLGMQYRNDNAMRKILDANKYDESQTVTLKIPISIPYMTDNLTFERVDGKFEHQGEHYRLVTQKYAKDTLTVVCVRDIENKKISQALSNYVKTFSDKASDQNQNSKITFNFIKDYLPQVFSLKSISPGWEVDVIAYGFYTNLIPSFEASVVHPPERA
jgi:hypothetical protein